MNILLKSLAGLAVLASACSASHSPAEESSKVSATAAPQIIKLDRFRTDIRPAQ